jgi:hypothetical protein
MQISRAAEAVLAELDRCGGHLMYDVLAERANLYDGDPAAGSPRGSERVETETFAHLRDNALITKTAGREVQRYEINEAGRAALSAVAQLTSRGRPDRSRLP